MDERYGEWAGKGEIVKTKGNKELGLEKREKDGQKEGERTGIKMKGRKIKETEGCKG